MFIFLHIIAHNVPSVYWQCKCPAMFFYKNIRKFIKFQQNALRRPCVPCYFIVHYIFCHRFLVCLSRDQGDAVQWIVASWQTGPVHGTATYWCDDTRDCIIQFCSPDDEHMCSKHVEAWNKLIIIFSASSLLILINKYIEMHGQQNIKKKSLFFVTDTGCVICEVKFAVFYMV